MFGGGIKANWNIKQTIISNNHIVTYLFKIISKDIKTKETKERERDEQRLQVERGRDKTVGILDTNDLWRHRV